MRVVHMAKLCEFCVPYRSLSATRSSSSILGTCPAVPLSSIMQQYYPPYPTTPVASLPLLQWQLNWVTSRASRKSPKLQIPNANVASKRPRIKNKTQQKKRKRQASGVCATASCPVQKKQYKLYSSNFRVFFYLPAGYLFYTTQPIDTLLVLVASTYSQAATL